MKKGEVISSVEASREAEATSLHQRKARSATTDQIGDNIRRFDRDGASWVG